MSCPRSTPCSTGWPTFADRVRDGSWLGHTGKPIRAIVNIGIGGSDLGPVMAYEALRHYSQRDLTFRFVSNVDGTDFVEATRDLDPAETLFIIASKTFTTLETMTNARSARAWTLDALGDEAAVAKHFVAVSTNAEEVAKFGIDTANMFGFWDWVGGRYSMDSAIGLSTMIAIGPEHFRALLDGFHAMDEHFRTAPFAQNLPVLMGAADDLVHQFLRRGDGRGPALRAVPEALPGLSPAADDGEQRQARHTRRRAVDYATGPIFWGEPGTNGQHSFYQLIHQGTRLIPCDFIAFAQSLNPTRRGARYPDRQCASPRPRRWPSARPPAEVSAEGTADWLVPHRTFAGNRPSNTILGRSPDARNARHARRALRAQRLHAGDHLANRLVRSVGRRTRQSARQPDHPRIAGDRRTALKHDSSTNALIRRYRERRDATS